MADTTSNTPKADVGVGAPTTKLERAMKPLKRFVPVHPSTLVEPGLLSLDQTQLLLDEEWGDDFRRVRADYWRRHDL